MSNRQTTPSRKQPVQTASPRNSDEPEPVILKRVNTRFLLTALGIVAGLGLGLHGLHGVQLEGNAGKLKDRAKVAEAEGEYGQAVVLLRQYLNFRENDYDALLHCLRLRDALATAPQARSLVLLGYEELLRRDPGRPDEAEIRQDLVAVALSVGQYRLARRHLTILLEQGTFQDDRKKQAEKFPEFEYQRGLCHQAEGRIKDAFEAYLHVLELQPGRHKYYLPLAVLFAENPENLPHRDKPSGNTAERSASAWSLPENIEALLPRKAQADFDGNAAADRVLEWMVEQAQSPVEAYLARARFRHQRRRFAEARQDVEQARSLASRDSDLLLFSARLAVDQAHDARLRGHRAGYFALVRVARADAAAGRSQKPHDARFPLLESLIENEVRHGLSFLPATAEKRGEKARFPAVLADPDQQQQWALFQSEKASLREGLDAVARSIMEFKAQKPKRTRLRNEDPHPQPNLSQLTELEIQLRWSLADALISEYELLARNRPQPTPTEAVKRTVNQQIEKLKKFGAAQGNLDFLKARLAMAEANWNEAAGTLEHTRLRLIGQTEMIHRIDWLLDRCYDRLGNPDQRLQVALRALRETPDWLPAIVRLPFLYQEANRTQEALKACERIQAFPGAALALARLRLQQELAKPAENRNWEAIDGALDAADSQAAGNSAEATILRAEVSSLKADQFARQGTPTKSQEKYRRAAKRLDQALQASPGNPELWAARALLELKLPFPEHRTSRERIRDAEAILQQAQKELGDHLKLRLAAVQIASLLPWADALCALSALEKPAFPPEQQAEFLERLARTYAGFGSRSSNPQAKAAALRRVLACRKQAAAIQTGEMAPQMALGELAFERKDAGTIDLALRRVERLEGPHGPNGNYLNALKLLLRFKPALEPSAADEKAVRPIRRLLQQAMAARPFWTVLPRTLGDLEAAVGNWESAVAHYEKAYELGDRTRDMITRIVNYYVNRRQFESADQFLRKVALDAPLLLSGELARRQGRVAEQLGRFEESGGIAGPGEARSEDFRDYILESRLRFSHGERGPQVLEPLKKARDMAPEQPGPWLALCQLLCAGGKTSSGPSRNCRSQKPHYESPALSRAAHFGPLL